MDSIMGAQSAYFSVLENSTCTQGDHDPLPLMSKGESYLVWLLPSSPKGEIIEIMIQVLSLMVYVHTHFHRRKSVYTLEN